MSQVSPALYRTALALRLGGMAVFTLVMTPVIFRTQPREAAAPAVSTPSR